MAEEWFFPPTDLLPSTFLGPVKYKEKLVLHWRAMSLLREKASYDSMMTEGQGTVLPLSVNAGRCAVEI